VILHRQKREGKRREEEKAYIIPLEEVPSFLIFWL